ncbi:hypothetical cytosolic protein [Syntrophus aciditrophicus SB]|uniref:Hypothetical cytosolic protein n=1 Tax=Syntrophus aciditrophicus (strain SB) TaxID=56780 RepID=Q2LQC7_SYNAS|nr:hypothetical cytosolic protein [Syntrophus aciditrophicus SB]
MTCIFYSIAYTKLPLNDFNGRDTWFRKKLDDLTNLFFCHNEPPLSAHLKSKLYFPLNLTDTRCVFV